MAKKKNKAPDYSLKNAKWYHGHLAMLDDIDAGDPAIGSAIAAFTDYTNQDRQSRHWVRAVQWMENTLFSLGRHYVDDLLISRIARDTSGNLSTLESANRNIPRPINDHLGRYIETNISLLTENRPRPRVTPKTERAEDIDAAEISELALEYLWEALNMPEKHREIARLILLTGVCFMEIVWDPTLPQRLSAPKTEMTGSSFIPNPTGSGPPIQVPVPRQVGVMDEAGMPVLEKTTEFGDIVANIISPFEMHIPISHWWDSDIDMPWIMREFYVGIDRLQDKFNFPGLKLNKRDGWNMKNLAELKSQNVRNLPIWWWERMVDIVEGPGPSLYVGTPEQWEGFTVAKWFDRKPNKKWPKGRSTLVAGDQVIYDSPKNVGARAYDDRWPERWHPYTRFRWESIPGSIYGRSMVSKLLPKLKRVNAIDTTLIMWRRTVPIATWIAPKGSHPVEDLWHGAPGGVWEYDPRRTAGAKPEPVFPPDYPRTALEERSMMIAEMESIAGTEEILRGQRPVGVNSASMIDILRKQALASRSPAIQGWDESLQHEGGILLQEVIKNIKPNTGVNMKYAERIRMLASEKKSRLSIVNFSTQLLSDNTNVRVDTASMALVSKEAREAKALQFLQYGPALMQMPVGIRDTIVETLGFESGLKPQGPDVDRAKRMLAYIRQGNFDRVIPFAEDDPFVFYEIFLAEYKAEAFWDYNEQQQNLILGLVDIYKKQVDFRQEQAMKMQMMMSQAGGGGGEGPPPGAPVQ
jgi:hypothetical protein